MQTFDSTYPDSAYLRGLKLQIRVLSGDTEFVHSYFRLDSNSRGDAASVSMIHHLPDLRVNEQISQSIGKVCPKNSYDNEFRYEKHISTIAMIIICKDSGITIAFLTCM